MQTKCTSELECAQAHHIKRNEKMKDTTYGRGRTAVIGGSVLKPRLDQNRAERPSRAVESGKVNDNVKGSRACADARMQ